MSGRKSHNAIEQLSSVYDTKRVVDMESKDVLPTSIFSVSTKTTYAGLRSRIFCFALGILTCVFAQLLFLPTHRVRHTLPGPSSMHTATPVSPPFASSVTFTTQMAPGSSQVFHFPPPTPTNAFPSLFPSNVGFRGWEGEFPPTGTEAAVIATAPVYPKNKSKCTPQLVKPEGSELGWDEEFNVFKKWGNLSPWYSVERGKHGVDSSPDPPDTCVVTGLHLLHRHGARYPSGSGGPADFAKKLNQNPDSWSATGSLEFLNKWTYKIGSELLTPFGRQQLYDLGVSTRMKYGFLLQNFTDQNALPVFRTNSVDRMVASAMNFAAGFFGYPFDHQYQQSITISETGLNNTLAPFTTCANLAKIDRAFRYPEYWQKIYLEVAQKRIQSDFHGLNISISDTYAMQDLCAYETVALGYSKFCDLFTEEEWEGYDYASDLLFWYGFSYGSPIGRAQGIGWVQELVARLTHTPIETHNSSTNSTLDDNPITFPLDQSLYVDATHDATFLAVLTTLNLTYFASQGPLPYTHIPNDRKFRLNELAPFATNAQFQLLECSDISTGPQIRIIINDAVVPLDGIRGCPSSKDDINNNGYHNGGKIGMCPLSTFVCAMKEIIREVDWDWGCNGDWIVPPGWDTTTGDPPPRPNA